MLRITPEAGLAIKKLATSEGVTETGGLRIEARAGAADHPPSLQLSVAATPTETDLVITEESTGARVLLDQPAADHLSDKTLDVTDTVESTANFRLTNQGTTED